jgi:hypothetical protein
LCSGHSPFSVFLPFKLKRNSVIHLYDQKSYCLEVRTPQVDVANKVADSCGSIAFPISTKWIMAGRNCEKVDLKSSPHVTCGPHLRKTCEEV